MRHANARMRQGEGGLGSWRCSSTPDQHRRRVSSIGHEKRDQPPLGRRAMTALGRSRQNWDQRLPRSCCSLEIGRLIQVPTSQCGLKLRNNRASSDEGLPTQGLRCDGASAGDEAVRDWFVNLNYLWSCDLSLPVKFNRSKFRFLQVKRPASRGCEVLDGARSFMRLAWTPEKLNSTDETMLLEEVDRKIGAGGLNAAPYCSRQVSRLENPLSWRRDITAEEMRSAPSKKRG